MADRSGNLGKVPHLSEPCLFNSLGVDYGNVYFWICGGEEIVCMETLVLAMLSEFSPFVVLHGALQCLAHRRHAERT